MTALFTPVQNGPACSGTGSVTLTCSATANGSQLVAVVLCPSLSPFTPPSASWRFGKSVAAGTAGHLEIWYLEGARNPGGITSVTFAGPSGVTCRGFLSEQSLPAGYSMILDAPGQASGTGGSSMALPSAAGCAADCLGVAAYADFFGAPVTGTWTTPSGWTVLRAGPSNVGVQWTAFASEDLPSGMHAPASGFSVTAGESGWCAALAVFRPVRFTVCGIAGGERIEVCSLDPTGQVMLAGGDVEGVFRSSDPQPGDHWQSVMDGVYGGSWDHFAALAWSVMPGEPSGTATVYALTGDQGSGGGFLVSADGGRSWVMRSTGVQGAGNQSGSPPRPAGEDSGSDRWVGDLIAQDPVDGYIYCCDANTGWVKRSHDLGVTWTAIPFAGSGTFYSRGVVCNPGNGKEIWACNWSTTTANGGVWHCADATVASPSWTRLTGYTGTVADMCIVGSYLYCACNTGGVYRAPLTGSALTSLNGGSGGGSTSTSLVGATVLTAGYPPAATKVDAIPLFDSYLDPKGTTTRYPLGKIKANWYGLGFMGEGATGWPTTATALKNQQGGLYDLAAAYPNMVFQYSLSPSRAAVLAGGSALTAEKNALAAFLTLLKAQVPAACYEICLWHEASDQGKQLFSDSGGTGQPSYQQYWNAYAPVIKNAGMPAVIAFLVATPRNNLNVALSMFPDGNPNAYPDVAYIDWYMADGFTLGLGTADPATYTGGMNPDTQVGGVSLVTKANAIKCPVGLCEWGVHISVPDPDTNPVYGKPSTYPCWTAFVNYLIALFTGAGGTAGPQPHAVADIVMYTGQTAGSVGVVTPPDAAGNPTDYKIGGIGKIYDTLSGSGSTGSGGLVTGGGAKYNGIAGYGDGSGNHTLIVGVGDGAKPPNGKYYTSVMKLQVPSGWPGTGAITYTDLLNQSGASVNLTTLPPDGRPWWKAGGGYQNWLGGSSFKDPRLVIDPNDTSRIFIAAEGGFWRTADGGKTWETAINGLVLVQSMIMAADPNTASHIVTGGDDYATFDIPDIPAVSAGVNAIGLGSGIECHAICFGPDSTVYAGGNLKFGKNQSGGVFSRAAGTFTWSAELGFAAKSGGNACIGLYAGTDASGTNFLLACAEGTGTFRATQNAGTGAWTWSSGTVGPMGALFPAGMIDTFTSKSGTSATIYCYDRRAGIYRSSDYGQTWTQIWGGGTAGSVGSGWLALNPNASGELWISTTNSPDGLYKMTGAGSGVVGSPGGPVVTVISGGPHPDSPAGLAFYQGILYVVQLNSASTPSAQLWTFDGTTWAQTAPEVGSYCSDPRQLLITSDGHALIESGYNGYIQAALGPVTLPSLAFQTSGALTPGAVGTAYAGQGLAAQGGTGTGYAFTLNTGSLPPGLTLSTDGSFSGTPTTATGSPFTFTAKVTDSGAHTATSGSLSIAISATAPLAITTTSVPPGVLGAAYGPVTLAEAHGTGPFTWALAAGSGPLPAGLSLSTGGVISGTPTAAGSYGFNVQVTDSASATDTQLLTIVVPAAALAVTTTSLPPVETGSAYSQDVNAGNGIKPYTWALLDNTGTGGLPAGLALTTNPSSPYNAVISGTVTAVPGPVTFTLEVTDSAGSSAVQILTIVVTPVPPPEGAGALFMIAGNAWVQPAPESLTPDGTAWQPDSEWTISGGQWA